MPEIIKTGYDVSIMAAERIPGAQSVPILSSLIRRNQQQRETKIRLDFLKGRLLMVADDFRDPSRVVHRMLEAKEAPVAKPSKDAAVKPSIVLGDLVPTTIDEPETYVTRTRAERLGEAFKDNGFTVFMADGSRRINVGSECTLEVVEQVVQRADTIRGGDERDPVIMVANPTVATRSLQNLPAAALRKGFAVLPDVQHDIESHWVAYEHQAQEPAQKS